MSTAFVLDHQHDQRRRQILDGATRVFLDLGYEGASMSVIAQNAGVSKGTLYVYFTNKEALFSGVIEDYCRRNAERFSGALGEQKSAELALLDFGKRYVTLATLPSVLAFYRLAIAESAKFPVLGQRFFESGPKQCIGDLTEFLRARVAAGELRIRDIDLAARQFLALCRAAFFMPLLMNATPAPPAKELEAMVRESVRVFLAAHAL